MSENNQSGINPEEESTKGFPIVTEEDEANAADFVMRKKTKDGTWVAAAPVSVSDANPVVGAANIAVVPEEEAETEAAETPAEQTAQEEMSAVEETEEAPAPVVEAAAAEEAVEETAEAVEEAAEEAVEEIAEAVEEAAEPIELKKLFGSKGKRIAAIAAGVAVLAVVAFSAYVYTYGKIFPGVTVAEDYKLSGMTQEEAQTYIANDVQNDAFASSIVLTGKDIVADTDKTYEIKLADVAESVDSAASAEQAYRMGREGGYFQRVSTVFGCIFGGRNISMNAELKDGAVEQKVASIEANLAYDPTQPSWNVDSKTAELKISTGRQGVGFDTAAVLKDMTAQAKSVDLDEYTIETYTIDQDKPDPAAIAKDVNTPPKNAVCDKNDGESIIEAVDGVEITEAEIATAIGDASEDSYTMPVKLNPAAITKADLEPLMFRDTIGQTTTYYNGGLAGRTTNVRLAAQAIDGTVLNPGETFSYNKTVGERTAARGYRSATIFSDGEEVSGLGGGVCQVSSTTYMAVLRADLEVKERHCHQFQVSYTPVSQDAAVYWGSKDFQFVNNTDYPIKIVASCGGGTLTVRLLGTKTEEKEITFSSRSGYGGRYKYASLYKTVTKNGESVTTKVNDSNYLLGGH